MDTKKVYSKKMLQTYRIFSIIGLLIELFCIINIFKEEYPLTPYFPFFLTTERFIVLLLDMLCFFLFIVLIFKPHKFEFISLMSFSYAIGILACSIEYEVNIMSFFMYILGVSCLLFRGFYNKKTKFKVIITVVFYFALLTTQIRFSLYLFFEYILAVFGYGLVFAISLFFLIEHFNQKKGSQTVAENKILDLSQYPDLSERDKLWLHKVQSDAKYETIAKESNVSLGTMKNRMHQIFKIIDVPDRISFLSIYGGYTIKD